MHLNLPWWLADSPVSFYRLFFIVITGTLLGLFVYVFLRMAGKLAGDATAGLLSYPAHRLEHISGIVPDRFFHLAGIWRQPGMGDSF